MLNLLDDVTLGIDSVDGTYLLVLDELAMQFVRHGMELASPACSTPSPRIRVGIISFVIVASASASTSGSASAIARESRLGEVHRRGDGTSTVQSIFVDIRADKLGSCTRWASGTRCAVRTSSTLEPEPEPFNEEGEASLPSIDESALPICVPDRFSSIFSSRGRGSILRAVGKEGIERPKRRPIFDRTHGRAEGVRGDADAGGGTVSAMCTDRVLGIRVDTGQLSDDVYKATL
ncbi:BZ3500_MvSof-1268-A1-R1_Chr4-3g07253 [Microbotryum saponariae]|uniref:BZ3500_MvSof-1268-A1-R1_Chr4-3g07253 protein n=1 Tax=Microbotryum saponariae TaxID=289078 RepID=A0A2X0NL96_9BASI|nr:BZ3500_MvSof-1268-A1-R1_Chr4-3g07253 [Microbotryum saponariae]SDA06916.1 BZ3501_MvSof-1269-A2-R1_Chr4-2g06962 [Microbotryum saponariae]